MVIKKPVVLRNNAEKIAFEIQEKLQDRFKCPSYNWSNFVSELNEDLEEILGQNDNSEDGYYEIKAILTKSGKPELIFFECDYVQKEFVG